MSVVMVNQQQQSKENMAVSEWRGTQSPKTAPSVARDRSFLGATLVVAKGLVCVCFLQPLLHSMFAQAGQPVIDILPTATSADILTSGQH